MLSICIPIYNYSIGPLLTDLNQQIQDCNEPIEIILIDDGSEEGFKQENRKVCKGTQYVELPQNIGRSAIRNKFLEFSKFNHHLYLDCDVLITKPDFLKKYLHAIDTNPDSVICGGRDFPTTPPNPKEKLRWKYGQKREVIPLNKRKANPYKSFLTNNFVVPKPILKKIPFNEGLINYGHEDTLFGIELKQHKIAIQHIDNPVENGDNESNETFLTHSEEAIKNLIYILNNSAYKEDIVEKISLLQTIKRLKPVHKFLLISFKIFKKPLKSILKKSGASLRVFDFYRLGFFLSMINQDKGHSNFQ